MRRFCLFQRGSTFYVKFWNKDLQKYDTAISTGKRSRNEALAKIQEWIRHGFNGRDGEKTSITDRFNFQSILYYISTVDLNEKQRDRLVDALIDRGIITEQATPVVEQPEESKEEARLLLPFLQEFWDYEKSPYVKEKLAYGQSIGKRHCYEQSSRINHWEGYFSPETRITDITKETLKDFQLALKDKKLAPKTINMILTAGTVPFKWVADRGELETNPAVGLRKFAGESKKRDILTAKEVQQLFSVKWIDERSRVGNLLSMTTGMRASEIVALQPVDITEDRLMIRHSYSFSDGLKKPKNGEERVVPLLPEIREELINLLMQNPHADKQFIFYGPNPDKPMNIDVLSKGLSHAYIEIKLTEKDKKEVDEKKKEERREETRKAMIKRGICFHSWRHFYTASLADRIEMRSVQLATGHKTTAMAEHYANHAQGDHLEAVSRAVSDVFAKVLHNNAQPPV